VYTLWEEVSQRQSFANFETLLSIFAKVWLAKKVNPTQNGSKCWFAKVEL